MGFAASNSRCCECLELEFTTTALRGQRMIVQVTNSGGDLGTNHFDLQIPGGGVGYFNGCSQSGGSAPPNGPPQFAASEASWGARYGGVSSSAACALLPLQLQDGCRWRFDDFQNADNPAVRFRRVQCPAALTAKSKCVLSDDSAQPPADGLAAGGAATPTTSSVCLAMRARRRRRRLFAALIANAIAALAAVAVPVLARQVVRGPVHEFARLRRLSRHQLA